MKIILSHPNLRLCKNMLYIFVDFDNVQFVRCFLGLSGEEVLNNVALIMENENIIGEKLKKILLLRYYICKNYK